MTTATATSRHGRPVSTWNPVDHREEACRLMDAARAAPDDQADTLIASALVHAQMAAWNYWGGAVQHVERASLP